MANNSIREQIILMKKGDSLTFSIDKVSRGTIRVYSSELGYERHRRFMTKSNRADRTITISRLA